jgi:hypothetical protein
VPCQLQLFTLNDCLCMTRAYLSTSCDPNASTAEAVGLPAMLQP